MARKKRGRRWGPRSAAYFDLFGDDPRAVAHRAAAALPLVACKKEAELDLFGEISLFTLTTWDAHCWLVSFDSPDDPAAALVGVYGLTERQVGVIAGHLVRHHMAEVWGVRALAAEQASTGRPGAPLRA